MRTRTYTNRKKALKVQVVFELEEAQALIADADGAYDALVEQIKEVLPAKASAKKKAKAGA